MESGVYSITAPSGKRYIGSSVKMAKRWREHRSALRRGVHINRKLQNAWNKHGERQMRFDVLLICAERDILMYEQIAIDGLRPAYNVLKIAGRSTGWKHSEATRAKMTAMRTGVKRGPPTEETKQKMRVAQVGKLRKPLSDEHRRRLSEFNKNRMKDPAVRQHLSEINKNKVLTEEHKRKIGDANRGRVRHAI